MTSPEDLPFWEVLEGAQRRGGAYGDIVLPKAETFLSRIALSTLLQASEGHPPGLAY